MSFVQKPEHIISREVFIFGVGHLLFTSNPGFNLTVLKLITGHNLASKRAISPQLDKPKVAPFQDFHASF
jgi:hypothetical protein